MIRAKPPAPSASPQPRRKRGSGSARKQVALKLSPEALAVLAAVPNQAAYVDALLTRTDHRARVAALFLSSRQWTPLQTLLAARLVEQPQRLGAITAAHPEWRADFEKVMGRWPDTLEAEALGILAREISAGNPGVIPGA